MERCPHQQQRDHVIKILSLGDSGVGKSTFLNHFADGTFVETFTSTVGIDFKEKRIIYHGNTSNGSREQPREQPREQHVHLQLWDTAGQERFRSLTTAFFRDAMGFLLTFDLTHEQSFINIRSWLDQLHAHAYCDHPALVLIGTKSDLVERRVVEQAAAIRLADTLGITYFETSALTGENICEAVHGLVGVIMEQMEKDEVAKAREERNSTIDLMNGRTVNERDEGKGEEEINSWSSCSC